MYSQSITRTHRTAFVFLIDGSGSMSEQIIYNAVTRSKAEVVAEITNHLLFELIERARREEGVRDYYDIAVMSYSGDDRISSLLPDGREMMSVEELSHCEPMMSSRTIECRMPDGSIALREIPTQRWIAPIAEGQPPMYEALLRTRQLLADWCSRIDNATSFPPVVFNITDGEATDCAEEDILTVANEIRALGTADGHVLLINIHIANDHTGFSVFFPSEEEMRYPNRYARLLYDSSSVMPDIFNTPIREVKGMWSLPPFRGMSFNASPVNLLTMLNIGSISVKTE